MAQQADKVVAKNVGRELSVPRTKLVPRLLVRGTDMHYALKRHELWITRYSRRTKACIYQLLCWPLESFRLWSRY